MTTSVVSEKQAQSDQPGEERASFGLVRRFVRVPVVRELLILLVFCHFTSMLTWPYVTRLRDAVVDPGDPYLMSWVMWWDYHQTFTNPLHLFDANVFYPFKYTLAFTEHSYGIAAPLFPLFALGLKPLTVHAIALFLGFALSGYGAFRLGRTLTGSALVGWVAGIVFAFVPYRFNAMSQVPYVFSAWIPLVFEALVLFARERSGKRAAWLGFAFFMSGITTITWFNLSLVPFVIYAAILLTRYDLWKDRQFWLRGALALGTAALLLVPFVLPYVLASRLYGFKRSIEEIKQHSAWPTHWLSVENRNRLWNGMGEGLPEWWKFKLFPGLLPILFSLAAFPVRGIAAKMSNGGFAYSDVGPARQRWVRGLDLLIVIALAVSILAVGFDRSTAFRKLFVYVTSERALAVLTVAIIARLCLAYPRILNSARANLLETLRAPRRGDAFWLGILLTVIGFCYSLGWNFFFYRICYDLIPMFRSMRVVTRGAMFAYLGLALLAGLGVKHLAEILPLRISWLRAGLVSTFACALLLAELNAAPLRFMRGEVYPDGVTARLKQTPMRGGIVVLPAGPEYNHRYILRAADHQKPLIVGTSSFNSPLEDKIEALTRAGAIPTALLDLFEKTPASYLVIENQSIAPERKADYQDFLGRAIIAGRLRFINRFDGRSDLYAVVKNEPEAKSEAGLSVDLSIRDWAAKIHEDPVNLLGQPGVVWSQRLYRIYLATYGVLPRYTQFREELETIGRGVVLGSENQNQQLDEQLRRFSEDWTRRESFTRDFGVLDDAQYVERLRINAGIALDPAQRQALVDGLTGKKETRAGVLLKIVENQSFVEREKYRSLLTLHYFGFLRRNPDDPPDGDLRGFEFWLKVLERNGEGRLSLAFKESPEYVDHIKPK